MANTSQKLTPLERIALALEEIRDILMVQFQIVKGEAEGAGEVMDADRSTFEETVFFERARAQGLSGEEAMKLWQRIAQGGGAES